MFTPEQKINLVRAKGIEEVEAVEKFLRKINPDAFLTENDLVGRVFYDQPGGHLGTATREVRCDFVHPVGVLEEWLEKHKTALRYSALRS